MAEINFQAIEKKWQEKWEKKKVFQVKEDSKKKKYYVLDMFPYPSASGLHIGHAFVYTLGDVFARFKRLQGFNVLYPIGYDSLGLPAENAAIKVGTHPGTYTKNSIKNFMKQQKAMGWSYDWSRMVKSHDSSYYKWDQWIFLKMLERGIAYRKKSAVNWCPKCNTVLANEQVINGKCWRHEDTNVEIKHLEQWFFRITDYAEELLSGLEKINWPENAKKLQRNWIGKSYGTEIDFTVNGEKWPIFTTRADTIYGVTFMVISAQHPRLFEIVTEKQKKEVESFLKKLKSVSEKELEEMEKEGVFTGSYAINPLTREKIPVYAGNFVLADYGCGMVMAVPAHDQRDFEFAEKYSISIKQVIAPVFVTTQGEDAVREDKKMVERDSVFGIVKHWREDKYYCLNWEKFNWKSFIIGGVEKGESFEEAIKREVKEETGYYDIKSIKEVGFQTFAKFFAKHKDENRNGRFKTFLIELNSDKYKEPNPEDIKNHKGLWIEKNKVAEFLNLKNNQYLWKIFLNPEAYTDEGVLINSDKFNEMNSKKAIEEISKYLESKKLGKKTVNYKLRDWLISRQRYWGTPIPIIYCEKCGIVPVPEKQLPVKLPEKVKFGKGNPLTTSKEFVNVKCPKCGKIGKRETDTMDTFVNSSWYYLRYCDSKNNKEIFDKKKVDYWCPINQYIGGPEHITMHLIYVRFYTKFLRDLGLLKFDEPALRYFTQGIVHGPDGEKMSKSRGNIIEPLAVIEKYGADTLRMALLSFASADKDSIWDEKIVIGSHKFLIRVYNYITQVKTKKSNEKVESKINKTIKEVSEDVENFKHNLALIKLRALFDFLEDNEVSKKDLESFLKMLHIYCPYITEELWSKIGNKGFISLEKWPVADEKKINEKFEKEEQAVEKLKEDINNIIKIIENRGEKKEKIYVYVLPNEKEIYDEKLISEKIEKQVKIFAVNDKNKYDPTNKSKNSKPGKPAIYLE